jgi:hypothetical protein
VPVLDGTMPPDGQLRVDDRPAPSGQTLELPPGKHVVTFSAPGFVDQRIAVELGAKEHREVKLVPQSVAQLVGDAPRPATKTRKRAPWVVLGLGLAITVGGAAVLGASAARFSSLQSECGTLCERSRWTGWQVATDVSYALLAVGGATAVGGLAWSLVSEKKRKLALAPAGAMGLALVFE